MAQIDTIIFDYGNVLCPVYNDYIKADIAKTLNLDLTLVEQAWNTLLPDLGVGKITEAEFWTKFIDFTKCTEPLPSDSLLSRQLIKRYAPFTTTQHTILHLKDHGYKLGVLSNTISAHVEYPKSQGLFDPFLVTIFSHEVGVRKPDPTIYQLALDRLGSNPKQSVFIDDLLENVQAAISLGIHGIVFTNDTQLRKDLANLGINMNVNWRLYESDSTHIGSHCLLITPDNQVILQQRNTDPNIVLSGKTGMFGGTLEANEDPLTGLRRELLEEVEIDANDYSIELLGNYSKTIAIDGNEFYYYIYLVKGVKPTDIKVHEGAGFVNATAKEHLANPNLTRITRLAIEDFAKQTPS